MSLPTNIENLIHGRTIEWERLVFKQGWNPEDVIHSMCGFANNINNWGGGYIIVGVAEDNGQPVFPPAGLQQNQLDAIQINSSDKPIFETDDASYVMVTLVANIVDQANDGASDGVKTLLDRELHDKVEGLITNAKARVKREELFMSIGLPNQSTNRKKHLDPIIEIGWIQMDFPDKPTHPNQRYKLTKSGGILLQL